jgi:hypothetical protein
MKNCNEIQKLIAELDSGQSIEDVAILKHIETCPGCQAYQETCEDMNQAFNDMNDFDADDSLVESTLSSIINLQDSRQKQQKPKRLFNTQWASALAASFMLVSLIALFPYNSISDYGLTSESPKSPESVDQISAKRDAQKPKRKEKKLKESDFEFYDVEVADEVLTKYRRAPAQDISELNVAPAPPKLEMGGFSGARQLSSLSNPQAPPMESGEQLSNEIKKNLKLEMKQSLKKIGKTKVTADDSCCDDDQDKVELERVVTTGAHIRATDFEEDAPVVPLDRNLTDRKQVGESQSTGRKKGLLSDGLIEKRQRTDLGLDKNKPSLESMEEKKEVHNILLSPAQNYLAELDALENIKFQKASGYWANTYVPGDSQMRLLHLNLEQNNILGLHNSIDQNLQPFDYPNNSALAMYLNSDHAYVKGIQRMRLQVGIQAANRKGGHRTAMNIALVFDLTHKNALYGKKMKALLTALLKAKQPGDNISLTIAGAPGARLIEAKDFRQGTIQVALNQLFTETKKSKVNPETLTLIQALQSATSLLQKENNASASLGSSVVMLFTADDIDNVSAIEYMAHNNALAGITMSTVSLSENNQETLYKLALAGQGHTRILASVDDAKRVIEAELLDSSRAVARALRLRIRLAKGVKLIKVLDSYNLNEQQAQRVRDSEQSLDQRLSKNLGITADRGDDEEGIQIVVPAFYAGDTHVILLDVVVSKPGAVADVTLRYKDLLYLRNATTRKQLSIESRVKKLGPLQLNVMKNVLAHRFANKLKLASDMIHQGNNNAALTELLKMQKLYQSMRHTFPTWNDDTEILNDEKLLHQYIKLLNANTLTDAKQLNYIADSMQYISWRKNITQTD